MERLSARDQRAALNFVRDAYAIRDFDAFVAFVLRVLPTVVRSEVTSYNEMWPTDHRSLNWVDPPSLMTAQRDEGFARVVHQEPVIVHYQHNPHSPLVRLSDFVSPRQLRDLALYSEHYGPVGKIEDTLPILWRGGGGAINAIGLLRHRRFDDRERALMEVLRPHLVQAHANALAVSALARERAHLEAALEAIRRAIVVLKPDRTIHFATGLARTWIAEYFAAAPAAERLPEALDLWVRQHDASIRSTLELPRPCEPLVINRPDRRVLVRLLAAENGTLLIMEEQCVVVDPATLGALGLTRRETEVLAAIASGRSKAEIARMLGMSPRTVDTHIQHIHERLNVSSSTAAAAIAFQTIRLHDQPQVSDDRPSDARRA